MTLQVFGRSLLISCWSDGRRTLVSCGGAGIGKEVDDDASKENDRVTNADRGRRSLMFVEAGATLQWRGCRQSPDVRLPLRLSGCA